MKQYKAYFEGSSDFYGDVMGVINEDGERVEAEFHYDEFFDMDQFISIKDLKEDFEAELAYEIDDDYTSYYDLSDGERQVLLGVSKHDFSDVEGFNFSQDEEIKILKKELLEKLKSESDEDWDIDSVKKVLKF